MGGENEEFDGQKIDDDSTRDPAANRRWRPNEF
jgi:hypothetical protein